MSNRCFQLNSAFGTLTSRNQATLADIAQAVALFGAFFRYTINAAQFGVVLSFLFSSGVGK